jgi:HK97 family phage portal protein
MRKLIFKAKSDESAQIIKDDLEGVDGIINPFFDFARMLEFFYANTYHRRAVQLKANLLSNIEDNGKLETATGGNPKRFLQAFILNLELYGNGFIEIARNNLYILPSNQARVDKDRRVWQWIDNRKVELEARQLAYYSPRSRFYGEPDYLGALSPLINSVKIDAFNSAFFDNGARADKAIIFEGGEPTDEQLTAFASFFGSNFRGFNNAHKTLIVSAAGENAKVRFEDLSKTDDLSFEKLKAISRDEIINAHGVPPRMMGVVTSSALGGGGELIGQLHAFNQLTIIPKQEEIEWFFDSIGFPIKLKPIDVANYKDDAELVTGLVQTGIMSLAEARSVLGYK